MAVCSQLHRIGETLCKIVHEEVGGLSATVETAMRTNWHYECVAAFLDGRLDVSQTSDIT